MKKPKMKMVEPNGQKPTGEAKQNNATGEQPNQPSKADQIKMAIAANSARLFKLFETTGKLLEGINTEGDANLAAAVQHLNAGRNLIFKHFVDARLSQVPNEPAATDETKKTK